MLFDEKSWNNFCKGFFVRDCTIGFEAGRIAFQLVEETEDLNDGWRTRLLTVRLFAPLETRFFGYVGNSLEVASLSSAWAPEQTEFIMVDTGRSLWSYKPKEYKGLEPPIPFDGVGYGFKELGKIGCAIQKVVRVGATVFAVGAPLRIFQRIPGQKWLEHKGIPIPAELKIGDDERIKAAITRNAFRDLAGFSIGDMYAVGDEGAVWHYNGKAWQAIPFPSNMRLYTVVCGADGNVYITDIRGSLWKGRGTKWELQFKADMSLPFADSVWFAGRLWCSNDYGTWVPEGKAWVAAHQAKQNPMPAEVILHSHRMDVSPDGKQLLVCGGQGAALHDGEKWNLLFSGLKFD